MRLLINGNEVRIEKPIKTIQDVIDYYHISNPVVIVEHNQQILEKSDHGHTSVKEGDKLELVQFVGGG